MKWGALLGFLAGAALSAWLLSAYGGPAIFALVFHAGWGLLAVILFHLIQIAASALAWRDVMGPTQPPLRVRDYAVLRWMREGVNNLLPVAQIGGEFVVVRLLRRRGVALVTAVVGTVGDLTMETVTQIAFTLLGLTLLLFEVGSGGIARTVIAGLITAAAVATGLIAAQNLGVASLIERGLAKFGAATGWGGFGEIEGLHQAMTRLYRSPGRLAGGAFWQSISWLLGGLEVCLILHVLGHDVRLGPGLVIESLGQALKAAGFAVPGALGVQEGGLIVVCHLFGITPELAIALSLVKRLREVTLGLPSLLNWRRLEARPATQQLNPAGSGEPSLMHVESLP